MTPRAIPPNERDDFWAYAQNFISELEEIGAESVVGLLRRVRRDVHGCGEWSFFVRDWLTVDVVVTTAPWVQYGIPAAASGIVGFARGRTAYVRPQDMSTLYHELAHTLDASCRAYHADASRAWADRREEAVAVAFEAAARLVLDGGKSAMGDRVNLPIAGLKDDIAEFLRRGVEARARARTEGQERARKARRLASLRARKGTRARRK